MRHGSTLFELLVSLAVLGALLLVISETLGRAQRSLTTISKATSFAESSNEAISTVRETLDHILLNSHPCFIDGTAHLEAVSYLHFVCGPANELLPDDQGVVGDALFYQVRGKDGTVECGGLFTQFNDDAETRPTIMSSKVPLQRHFRLMHWQQPAAQSSLFVSEAGLPILSLKSRAQLYRWFRDGIRQKNQLHVVADHVLAMWLRTSPEQRCYDTQRLQWEGPTPEALASSARLPITITARFLLTNATSWTRQAAGAETSFANRWLQCAQSLPDDAIQEYREADHWLRTERLDYRGVELVR